MKIVFAILFLCSAALSQQATVNQSSELTTGVQPSICDGESTEVLRFQKLALHEAEVADQWRERYVWALQYAQASVACLNGIVQRTPDQFNCSQKDVLAAKLMQPLPGETIKKKPKAGAHSKTLGKPATEKTKTHSGRPADD